MTSSRRSPWFWIPSLYFAQGIPYVIVMTMSVIMYKRLGISNTDIAFYTSWLYLPWVIKPLWSPVVDILRTKRFWIITLQFVIGAALAGAALALPAPAFFQYTLAIFWLMAFSSATHDIAADGFYMLALNDEKQAFFVGIRSTFYRIAMISGQGLLVILAGELEVGTIFGFGGSIPAAWAVTLGLIAALFIVFATYHLFVLPRPGADVPAGSSATFFKDFFETFVSFFRREKILIVLGFLLLYRFGEAQLVKLASPFLLDGVAEGGLGLTTSDVGFVYGTVGVLALTVGGIVGGIAVSRHGLKHWLWPMILAINVPDLVYVFLALVRPESFFIINIAVGLEQLGYGFGFTAYMMFMIYISRGKHATAHYAICTGFMALGMMIPGMFSGWVQESIGYTAFFVWICVATIPGFIMAKLVHIDPDFGKKKEA